MTRALVAVRIVVRPRRPRSEEARVRRRIFTYPEDGDRTTGTRAALGQDLDLTGTVLGLTVPTAGFRRDRD
ncbi:hypothetical protein J7I94_10965 [Streptomyces sp. ISL-12]|uniref:hypothetical protein n=1 Tax=Streptomyces sp. ISL-12 TaxID=2819177 RepID=UPI001BE5503B|nr:hypothetical protein [Streptomyces sp. ISL-12]MBT2411079.1 hypothetical protein [Streptomyces sp. ISL-12]